jgi:hypothetical protein
MAKNSINQKSSMGVQLGRVITVLPKVDNFKGIVELKDPASGSEVNSSKLATVLTHERIAKQAWVIWQSRGCRPGEDERNWSEAEAQLKAKLGIN